MKKILFVFSFLIFFSCNKIGISDQEVNAVQQVLNFYGGEINRSIGFETKNATKKKYFELAISKSKLLENDTNDLSEHAGNIAYLFYSNLNIEKSKYDEVKVKISLKNGENREYNFSKYELAEIEKLQTKLNQSYELIKNNDFKFLANIFSNKIPVNDVELKNIFDKLHEKYGNIKQIQFQGFTFGKDEKMGDYIVTKNVIVLDKSPISMYLTFDRKSNDLFGLSFP